jgi:hypothetical protein
MVLKHEVEHPLSNFREREEHGFSRTDIVFDIVYSTMLYMPSLEAGNSKKYLTGTVQSKSSSYSLVKDLVCSDHLNSLT